MLLKSVTYHTIIVSWFVGVECIEDFVGVEFVVVYAVVGVNSLAKSAYSLKIESLQLHLFWSDFSRQA